MKTEPIILQIKIALTIAEYHIAKGHQGDADKQLYRIYNFIHFDRATLNAKQRKNRPPGRA